VVVQEPTPPGIALYLYEAFGELAWEGRIVLVGDDVDSTVWLSRTARVLHGVPLWAAATMDIQQASDDLFNGRTELTVGPPTHLGPTDLLGLRRKGRTAPPTLPDLGPGGSPVTPPFPPHMPPRPPRPEPPHEDHDPSSYASPRTSRSGAYNTISLQGDCGGTFPACPVYDAPVAMGAPPPFNIVAVGGTSFGAALDLGSERQFSSIGGGAYHFVETQFGTGNICEWTFDLSLVASNVIGAALIGTKTLSKSDGTSETSEARIELAIGTVINLSLSAVTGATYYSPVSNSWEKWGSISYPTLRFYLRP
jgi:hypothetical protein